MNVLSAIINSFYRYFLWFNLQRTLLTTHPEIRKDPLSDGMLEGIDVCVVLRVVERHPALVKVQLHSDLLRALLQVQPRQR